GRRAQRNLRTSRTFYGTGKISGSAACFYRCGRGVRREIHGPKTYFASGFQLPPSGFYTIQQFYNST
ncbi:MAG: hypothetical protein LAT80_06930, partial [Balneolaceae bacterium]|nr:hypothetical protein [Balneolaceae bacterium]